MRVFIVLLALAYWGLASLAQSHLANGGSYNPPAQKRKPTIS
jgi:hypothetical protein